MFERIRSWLISVISPKPELIKINDSSPAPQLNPALSNVSKLSPEIDSINSLPSSTSFVSSAQMPYEPPPSAPSKRSEEIIYVDNDFLNSISEKLSLQARRK